ncbi:hypothetical protein [Kluyvera genomosp. 1]|uniref:hypothetical protein n=1 Tax=Kluyvera genomosp. 1 TaxID=2774053 RepID=UPI00068F53E3|nr:hypothetical protein [Kluyvera genomosp. 1]
MSVCMNQETANVGLSPVRRGRVIALSMTVSVGALLVAFPGPGAGSGLLLILIAGFAVGMALLHWPLRKWGERLSTMRYGLWLSALGWLLILLPVLGGQGALNLWPGAVLGGLGAGIAFGSGSKTIDTQERMAIAVGGALALVATSCIAFYSAPGIERFCFALALPIDLALLGVVMIRIAENEER